MKYTDYDEENENDYSDWGGRNEYLEALADEYGLDPIVVFAMADALGPSEDFDGLVTELEDIAYTGGYEYL